jgi:hypothetical protein
MAVDQMAIYSFHFCWHPPLAFVCNELFLDVGVCILGLTYRLGICRKLSIAIFTHAKHRNVIFSFDDPKLAFRSSDTDGRCSASIVRRTLTVRELLYLV